MKKIIFLGMPGAGKGVQAKLLEKFGLKHISTGDLIREAFKNNDPIADNYRDKYDSGELLSDELIFQLIEKAIKVSENGYVLDGAVRTMPQAEFAMKNNLANTTVFFSLPKKVALARLENRMKNSEVKRSDDDSKTFENRFSVYKKKTEPIIDFLKQNTDFHEIDASPNIEKIHEEVVEALGLKE